ncbi:MAG: hypothetical protein KKF44_07710 [Nanoarchaeota archaeon]|nr:hypothetical protein [Nanoarchaeota archaeon]
MAITTPETVTHFVYIAPIAVGIACGFLELIFVHEDEPGMGWLTHGMHAIPFCVFFSFISMNLSFVYTKLNLGFTSNPTYDLGIRAVIGLLAAFKIKAAAAVTKGHGSIGEKLGHSLAIGAIIAVAPYIWPFIAKMKSVPSFLKK